MSSSLRPPELQHARLPCPSLSPGVCSNSCPFSQWCYPTISSSVTHFFCPQSFQASGSFPMSRLFASGYIWVNERIQLQKEVWSPNTFQIFITCYFGCFFFYGKRLHWGSLYWIIFVDHNKLWKILKEMGIPDHLTSLLRNLYSGQEATFRTGHWTTDWFQIGKGVLQGCILSSAYLT